jgi:Holliday junction resolvase RusA-like endonuclease
MKPITFFVQGDPMGEPRTIPIAIPIPGKRGKRGRYRGAMLKPNHFNINHKDPDQARWARANVWARSIAQVVEKFLQREPLDLYFRVDEEWIFARPANHYGSGKNANTLKASAPFHCGTKPDRDNADKLLLDTITDVKFWVDDNRAVDGRIIKRYQRDNGERSGVWVRISRAVAGASIFDDAVQDVAPELFNEANPGTAVRDGGAGVLPVCV